MRVVSGIVIGAALGLFGVFVCGAILGGVNNPQTAFQSGLGMLMCFGWIGLVVGGALGAAISSILVAVNPNPRSQVEYERMGQFRLLQRDLAQAESDLDEREALILELRAEIARLRRASGPPVGDDTTGE